MEPKGSWQLRRIFGNSSGSLLPIWAAVQGLEGVQPLSHWERGHDKWDDRAKIAR